jgi:2-C-methyl-D-erythritol 4-phosphate cytidylyltransferase / 2-C-methyl-D-erythritol 2,4-cyclodiphosphate synthase
MTDAATRVPSADVVVPAAGSSWRMGGRDKLGESIRGRPVLAWTLANLAAASAVDRIVVVVPPSRVEEIRAAAWLPPAVVAVVAGGSRRQESVAAGIDVLVGLAAHDDRVVLVHDAARPLIDDALVARVAAAVVLHGAAVPVIPVVDTLKRLDGDRVRETVDRETLGAAQTPQGVRLGLLLGAYARFPPQSEPNWTDEAALLEACTIPVHVVPGDPRNVKVTVPDDLERVRHALAPGGPARLGFGHDSHPFGAGSPLQLGGITLDGAPRLAGHSDGDVALHAVADALLGGAALGDLGRHFPPTSATPAGVASGDLLAAVSARVAEVGYAPSSVDLTIVAARPRLGSRLDEMRSAIAALLSLDVERVSVKASTGNLIGPEGAGRAVSAHAVAVLEPVS